jgi:hypothetical protein
VTYAAGGLFTSAAQKKRANLTPRRVVFVVLAGALFVFVVIVLASPFPALALRMMIEELYPAAISWDGKTAWKRCDSAIAGRTSWPQSPQAACTAMFLCVNEAPLSDPQKQLLSRLIHDTPGCPEP